MGGGERPGSKDCGSAGAPEEGSAWGSLAVYSLGQQGPFSGGALAPTLSLGRGKAPAVAGIDSTCPAAPERGARRGSQLSPGDFLGPSTV